ncbi:MAG TPA: DinB family protein [Candidatus Aquilonibacter sp.]|nr:DinB family protein [Candidatus Aquilonibacter sp.]
MKAKTRKSAQKGSNDKALREHLVYLLSGGGAHAGFDDVLKDLPENLRGVRPGGFPHSAWMLLEHMRLAQWDILDFSRNAKYASKAWPEDYWPQNEAPPDANAWSRSVQAFRKDLTAMQDLVSSPKTDLYAHIPWGDGQTILREALLVADHNAYHLGQLVDVLRLLGSWQG